MTCNCSMRSEAIVSSSICLCVASHMKKHDTLRKISWSSFMVSSHACRRSRQDLSGDSWLNSGWRTDTSTHLPRSSKDASYRAACAGNLVNAWLIKEVCMFWGWVVEEGWESLMLLFSSSPSAQIKHHGCKIVSKSVLMIGGQMHMHEKKWYFSYAPYSSSSDRRGLFNTFLG